MKHKETIMEVLGAALRAADPYRATSQALQSVLQQPVTGKVYVVGAGKAGAAMARAAEEVLGERVAGGVVIVKDGYTDTGGGQLERIKLLEASHPVPDSRGVKATGELLEMVDAATENDLIVCLISGGGSALLVSPAEGLALQDIQITTSVLLRVGANINELNAVRKHLSQVSGGQMARRAAPARVVALVLSDVIGSPLDVIASGPTSPDPSTYEQALAVLERHGSLYAVPPAVLSRLHLGAEGKLPETPKPHDPIFEGVSTTIVADNVIAVEAAAAHARKMGLDTLVASTYIEGEAREVGVVLGAIAKEIATHGRSVKRPGCVLFGGETTVTVRGSGLGGRNSELALSAALALQGWGADVAVASLATDGGDGSSQAAGAIADGTTIDRSKRLGLDAHAALANNDSATFWHALGDAIQTGPTGTNVNDVMGVFVL